MYSSRALADEGGPPGEWTFSRIGITRQPPLLSSLPLSFSPCVLPSVPALLHSSLHHSLCPYVPSVSPSLHPSLSSLSSLPPPPTPQAHSLSSPLDLQDILARFTFDNIARIAFGVDPGCLAPGLPSVPFAQAFDAATKVTPLRGPTARGCTFKAP